MTTLFITPLCIKPVCAIEVKVNTGRGGLSLMDEKKRHLKHTRAKNHKTILLCEGYAWLQNEMGEE